MWGLLGELSRSSSILALEISAIRVGKKERIRQYSTVLRDDETASLIYRLTLHIDENSTYEALLVNTLRLDHPTTPALRHPLALGRPDTRDHPSYRTRDLAVAEPTRAIHRRQGII